MVRVQRATAQADRLLIGSDLPDALQARRELEQWAGRNGYHLPKDACHLSVFESGALVREWVVVDTAPVRKPRFFANPFLRRWKQAREQAA